MLVSVTVMALLACTGSYSCFLSRRCACPGTELGLQDMVQAGRGALPFPCFLNRVIWRPLPTPPSICRGTRSFLVEAKGEQGRDQLLWVLPSSQNFLSRRREDLDALLPEPPQSEQLQKLHSREPEAGALLLAKRLESGRTHH